MTPEQQSDYENRDVDYSLIHGETKEVFSKFVKALQLKNGMKLLDLGGGYGSVFVNILRNEPGIFIHYDILDNSLRQIKKARKNIDTLLEKEKNGSIVNYVHQSAGKMDLRQAHYDVVVCKMFIHEVPSQKKELVFKKIHEILRPGGRVFFWNPDLTEQDHHFFKETIRKKDELAKFTNLVKNRHFLLNSELTSYLENSGFSGIEKLFDFNYDLHTSLRLKAEFQDKEEHLKEWNTHILNISNLLSPELRKTLLIDIKENNIHIRFKRAVFKAVKT